MVCLDKGCHKVREIMLLGQLQTVRDMLDNSYGALLRSKSVMVMGTVAAKAVVLDEASRIKHLADIMIQGTGTNQ